jgi:hypothetical protein
VQGVVHPGRRLRQGAALRHLRATAGDGTRRVRADHAHRPQDARTLLVTFLSLSSIVSACRVCTNAPCTQGTGLPFNKYSWLTTHNSFAVVGTKSPLGSAIISPPNQEDSVSEQLKNGVRGLMLDAYDFNDAVWFCHSFHGRCLPFTAYVPALSVLTEVRVFLEANPSEVVTVFLEDYAAPGSLSNAFNAAGLSKYWFPESLMPSPSKGGGDWPLLKDMIADDHRLIVFTSKKGKQGTEGLAYQWDYVVETQCTLRTVCTLL